MIGVEIPSPSFAPWSIVRAVYGGPNRVVVFGFESLTVVVSGNRRGAGMRLDALETDTLMLVLDPNN